MVEVPVRGTLLDYVTLSFDILRLIRSGGTFSGAITPESIHPVLAECNKITFWNIFKMSRIDFVAGAQPFVILLPKISLVLFSRSLSY